MHRALFPLVLTALLLPGCGGSGGGSDGPSAGTMPFTLEWSGVVDEVFDGDESNAVVPGIVKGATFVARLHYDPSTFGAGYWGGVLGNRDFLTPPGGLPVVFEFSSGATVERVAMVMKVMNDAALGDRVQVYAYDGDQLFDVRDASEGTFPPISSDFTETHGIFEGRQWAFQGSEIILKWPAPLLTDERQVWISIDAFSITQN